MNDDGGFVRSFRRKWENPVFRNKMEAAVWAWMIDTAQWQDRRMATKFGPISLRRGELVISERELSDDFGLHRNTLRALIQRMVDDGMISLIRDRIPHRAGTIVHITKYEEYQCVTQTSITVQDHKRTEEQTGTGPKEDRNGTKNNEGNEDKKEVAVDARAHGEQGEAGGPLPVPAKLPSVMGWKSKSGGMSQRDRLVAAVSQSLTDAIEAAYGHEHLRVSPPQSEKNLIPRYLDLAADLKISEDAALEMMREYFFTQCAKRREDGLSVPGSVALFEKSITDMLHRFAMSRDRPLAADGPMNGRQGSRKPYATGGDAPTANTVEQPWQRIQKKLMSAGQVGAARELSAASAHGPAAANQLAAELEGRHLPKRQPAAQAA